MRAVVTKKELAAGLRIAAMVAPDRGGTALQCVSISTDDIGLHLRATNHVQAWCGEVKAQVLEEGAIAVYATEIKRAVAGLPDRDIIISGDGTGKAELLCPPYKLTVGGIHADEYPTWDEVEPKIGDMGFEYPDRTLDALAKVLPSVSGDEFDPLLQCVNMRTQPGDARITFAATDKSRLAVAEVCMKGQLAQLTHDIDINIPAATIALVCRVFAKSPRILAFQLRGDGERAWFYDGMTEITTSLVDAKYPNFARVIPSEDHADATFMTEAGVFEKFLKSAYPVAMTDMERVTLEIERNGVRIRANGSYESVLDGEGPKEPYTIAINCRFLRDALAMFEGSVCMYFTSPLAPVLLRKRGLENRKAVIMPMQMSEAA